MAEVGLEREQGCRPVAHPFGIHLPSPEAVRGFRDRLAAESVMIVEELDEADYVSVKCLDPDGYIVTLVSSATGCGVRTASTTGACTSEGLVLRRQRGGSVETS
jgi:hypothetical protein